MRTTALLAMVMGALLMQPAVPAWAHAKLVRSDPAARAVVKRMPAAIHLWFNERVEPAYSTVELRDATGKVISTQKASVSATDAKQLVLPLPGLIDGDYVVIYRVLSVDGHVVKSRYRFTVRTTGP